MSAESTTPVVNQGTGGSSAWKTDGSASTQPVSGTVTVQQSTASNLKVDLSGTGANSTAILVNGTGGTFPISGTVAVTQSTSPWVVGSATLQLDTTGASLNVAQGASTTSKTGPLIQGAATTSAPSYTTATVNPLSLTTGGLLRVDGTGGTFPVSGSVTVSGTVAATQSGTWTVQPGNTANSTAWLVTGTGGTFPITSSTLQLDTTGAALNLAQGSTTSGQTGPLIQTATTTSAPSYTTAKTNPLSTTTTGNLRVDGAGGTFPVSGTVTATTSYVSITATGGTFASSGNNTLITPSNSLRISYLSLNAAAANTAAVLCIVKFTTGGSTIYEVQLLPGAIWAHHPAAGLHYVTGTSGQALVVNLDSAQTVYWSLEYADV